MTHELRQVRAFLKVAELQSFTRAAAELHVSQSALTVQVKQLEEELGVLLLDRNKRGVTITTAGRDLLGPLQRLVADAEAIAGYARGISALRTGTLAIAAELLPAVMRKFLRRHAEVRITVHDVVAGRVRELVAKRAVDLGLGTAAPRDRELAAKPLYQDRLAAFVAMDYPLAKRGEISLHELMNYELILPHRDSSVRRIVEAAMGRNRELARIRHETSFIPTALGMARGTGSGDPAGVGGGANYGGACPAGISKAAPEPADLPVGAAGSQLVSLSRCICGVPTCARGSACSFQMMRVSPRTMGYDGWLAEDAWER